MPTDNNLAAQLKKSIKTYQCTDRRKCEHPHKRYHCPSCGVIWFKGWTCPLCGNFGVVRYD